MTCKYAWDIFIRDVYTVLVIHYDRLAITYCQLSTSLPCVSGIALDRR